MVGDEKVLFLGIKVGETVLCQLGDRAANDLFVHVVHHVDLKFVGCPDGSYHLTHFFDVSVGKDIACQQSEVPILRYSETTNSTMVNRFYATVSPKPNFPFFARI